MRILHINKYDIYGGAARGVFWLHQALRKYGHDSQLLVSYKGSDDPTVTTAVPRNIVFLLFRNFLLNREKKRMARYGKPERFFSPDLWTLESIHYWLNRLRPDIVNLHWISRHVVMPEDLPRIRYPLVWTFRDMWPLTGGCHYAMECERYLTGCGSCPVLHSTDEHDVTRSLFRRKQRAYARTPMVIVCISRWLADCARNSPLLRNHRVEVIHNAVDTSLFAVVSKKDARERLGLSEHRKVILFGSSDPIIDARKGFSHVEKALTLLKNDGWGERSVFWLFGDPGSWDPATLGFPAVNWGKIDDDRKLSLLYAAADVMLVPSIQEAFGKTCIEAMSCGTPVVVFDATGLRDIVDHEINGYRAQPFRAEDLAAGIAWVLNGNNPRLSENSRAKVEECFTYEKQVSDYIRLYESVLESKR